MDCNHWVSKGQCSRGQACSVKHDPTKKRTGWHPEKKQVHHRLDAYPAIRVISRDTDGKQTGTKPSGATVTPQLVSNCYRSASTVKIPSLSPLLLIMQGRPRARSGEDTSPDHFFKERLKRSRLTEIRPERSSVKENPTISEREILKTGLSILQQKFE